jgi:hypothetical protein
MSAIPKFDMSTLSPGGATNAATGEVAAQTSRTYIAEGDAFTLMFSLPYAREDLFRELISPRQLGVDHTSVKISVTKRSAEAEADLQRALTESARGNAPESVKQQEQAHLTATLTVGCERTVQFPDGKVVSELVELVEPARIRWRQLVSERATNMVGKPGGSLPEVTIALDPLPDGTGTSVRMTYDFYQILKSDGTPLDGGMMSKLLSQATRGWAADMKSRGYQTVDGGEARTGRAGYSPGGGIPDFGSTVLRSARKMKSDIDEEAAMKQAMLEKAKASMK